MDRDGAGQEACNIQIIRTFVDDRAGMDVVWGCSQKIRIQMEMRNPLNSRRNALAIVLTLVAPVYAGPPNRWSPPPKSPLRWTTIEARPIPLQDKKEIEASIARLSDRSHSPRDRAEAADRLAAVEDPKVIEALADVLVEVGDPDKFYVLRRSCANALKWSAAGENQRAIRVLYESLTQEDFDLSSGRVVALALLDARGAAEVIGELGRAFRGERSRFPTIPLQSSHQYIIVWGWVEDARNAYHFTADAQHFDLCCREAGLFARRLSTLSEHALAELLEKQGGWLAQMVSYSFGPDQILPAVLKGAEKGRERVRTAAARWVVENARFQLGGRLDRTCLIRLDNLAKSLPDDLVEEVRKVINKLCWGRAADVLRGDAVLNEVACGELKILLQTHSSEGAWDRLLACDQIGFAAAKVIAVHPYTRLVNGEGGWPPAKVREVLVGNLISNPYPGYLEFSPAVREKIVEMIDAFMQSHWIHKEYDKDTQFGYMLRSRTQLATQGRGKPILEWLARLKDAGMDLDDRDMFLFWIAPFTYGTEVTDFPVRFAREAIDLHRVTDATERWRPNKEWHNNLLHFLSQTSPEFSEFDRLDRNLLTDGAPEPSLDEERDQAQKLLKSAEAWLERFKKLPQFATTETPNK